MVSAPTTGQVVAKPTYMADIRFFFTSTDIAHMAQKGIDLSSYDGVKKNAAAIYAHTGPNGDMPPGAPWSDDQHQTFLNWILTGMPLGSATPATISLAASASASRVRRDIESLDNAELAQLQTAFKGLMARDANASDPNSYFALAGIHGLPGAYCQHHVDAFNPWHRWYLKVFEDQLRTVPGCEDLTLPYWDFTRPIPPVLTQAPFAQYTLPRAIGGPFNAGYTTKRYDWPTIQNNMEQLGVYSDISSALLQSLWGEYLNNGFQNFFDQAHDGGHVAIGPTMANQSIASFDPIFWFYHCNLDRLWLDWQIAMNATTMAGFLSTLAPGADQSWLKLPFNTMFMAPFKDVTTGDTITMDIAYTAPVSGATGVTALENKAGSVPAAAAFSVKRSSPVSVRVKGIARLNIPGAFVVSLLADGEPVAKRAFFQPSAPKNCPTCEKVPLVNLDFRLDAEQILDKTLTVEIDVPDQVEAGTRFPLSQAGDPSVNVRLLLDQD